MAVELQECRVLRIEPGDILVFETEDRLSRENAKAIHGQLLDRLADAGHAETPVMVLSGDGHLTKTQIAKAA